MVFDVGIGECECSSHESLFSRLKRSKSYPHKRFQENKLKVPREGCEYRNFDDGTMRSRRDARCEQTGNDKIQTSLKQEIIQLEKRLSDQFAVRHALEKALGYRSNITDTLNDNFMPKPTKELIKEISLLELEVMYLEQYLLSLYRKAFDQQQLTQPSSEDEPTHFLRSKHELLQEVCGINTLREGILKNLSRNVFFPAKQTTDSPNGDKNAVSENLSGPSVHRSHSELSQRSVCSARSPQNESINKAIHSCYSQPLPYLEHKRDATAQAISLAEYLSTSITENSPETANGISEDLIRCISSIYCEIVEPPLVNPIASSSASSSCSTMSPLSPQYVGNTWSPRHRKGTKLSGRLENPYGLEGLKEFGGPYSAMLQVLSLPTVKEKLSCVEDMLKTFRLLINRLKMIDLMKMKNEEKLAFWINIHNALVMHAYVEYGIPKNYLKKSSLLLKATCNIGGLMISAETVQNLILGCRMHRPGQWLRTLLSPKSKTMVGEELQAHALDHLEPLLHFALCSGSHSDPAVRVYTPNEVYQQLNIAKTEYIRATMSIRKEQKIILPKILETFARESNLSQGGLVDVMQKCLPETLQMAVERCQAGRSQKCIEWVPHNFTFRYLLSRDLAHPKTV